MANNAQALAMQKTGGNSASPSVAPRSTKAVSSANTRIIVRGGRGSAAKAVGGK